MNKFTSKSIPINYFILFRSNNLWPTTRFQRWTGQENVRLKTVSDKTKKGLKQNYVFEEQSFFEFLPHFTNPLIPQVPKDCSHALVVG